MEFIADLHIHSKYSRATSRDMDIRHLAEWAKLKGITLMGTGDFTHHIWLEELKHTLEDCGNGLFKYAGVYFMLTAEVLADSAFLEEHNLVHTHLHKHSGMAHVHSHEHPAHDHSH